MALGAMPVDHPLSLGMLGMHGARCTNLALDECDLLIAVGARFDDRATGKVVLFCPGRRSSISTSTRLNSTRSRPHHRHRRRRERGLQGLAAGCPTPQALAVARGRPEGAHPLQTPGIDDLRTHYGLISAPSPIALDDEATISTDVGQHQMWVAQAYPLRRPRQWLTSGRLRHDGFGVPAAIGAAC